MNFFFLFGKFLSQPFFSIVCYAWQLKLSCFLGEDYLL